MLAVLGLCWAVPPTGAQDSPERSAPERALAAFGAARAALDDPDAPAIADDFTLASVTLRQSGRVVARASASAERGAVAAAFARALGLARERTGGANDATREARLAHAARGWTLSIEVGLSPTPLLVAEGTDLDAELSPGIDGVRCVLAGAVGLVFPGEALEAGWMGAATASTAAGRAGDPADAVEVPWKLAERGAAFHRFRTLHAVQDAPDAPPRFVHRGGRIVRPAEISGDRLAVMARGLALFVAARVGEDGALAPGYDPIADRELPSAGDASSTLALAALAAASLNSALESGALLAPEHAAVSAALERLRSWIAEAPGSADVDHASRRIAGVAPAAWTPEPGWEGGREAGWIAWGLAVAGDDAAAGRVLAAQGARGAAAQLPFVAWAAGRSGGTDLFADMREELRSARVGPGDPADADFEGGRLIGAVSGWPAWRGARSSAALGSMMLHVPRADEPREAAELLAALRFTRQLCVEESHAFLLPEPERARWGVRASLWDFRQPTEASATALLQVTDARRALRLVAREQPGESPPPP